MPLSPGPGGVAELLLGDPLESRRAMAAFFGALLLFPDPGVFAPPEASFPATVPPVSRFLAAAAWIAANPLLSAILDNPRILLELGGIDKVIQGVNIQNCLSIALAKEIGLQ